MEVMVDAQLERDAEQVVSSTREVFAAELNVWKKEFEFWRSNDTGWQLVTSSLLRESETNFTQLVLAKLLDKVSKGVGIFVAVFLLAVTMRRSNDPWPASVFPGNPAISGSSSWNGDL